MGKIHDDIKEIKRKREKSGGILKKKKKITLLFGFRQFKLKSQSLSEFDFCMKNMLKSKCIFDFIIKFKRGGSMLKGLKDRKFKVSLSVRNIVTVCLLFILTIVTASSAVYSSRHTLAITDGENPEIVVTTFKKSVKDVLSENGFKLNDGDKLSVSEDVKLTDGMNIKIYRAMCVSVIASGEKKDYLTTKRKVGEILAELGIAAKDTDKTTPGYYDTVDAFSEILLVRTSEEEVSVMEEIPYESVEKINKSLAKGAKKVTQEGAPGEKQVVYKIAYEDGVEVSREKVSETVTKEPVKRVTEVAPRIKMENYQIASAGSVQTSRSGNLAYSRVLSMNATGYDASSCGKSPGQRGYGVTATGRAAVHGVVAVDPSVIPMGTRLYIESADGRYVYGTAVAGDTGGAIKGSRIDLCFNTNGEARSFGRRTVNVYVLN